MSNLIEELGFEVPEDWEVVKLKEIVELILTGATPLRSNKEYWVGGEVPWLTNEEVKEDIINYIKDTKEKITQKAVEETNVKIIPPGSVIVSLTASVGKVAINLIPITTNQQFNSFIVKKEKILPQFLAYYFLFMKQKLKILAGTTTFNFISKGRISNFYIILPPLPEQKRIAEILSTFDKAIERVDEIITKTERLKKGLMQRLLTRGIGHTKFKFVEELGFKVPEDWKVVKVSDLFIVETGTTPSTKVARYWDGSINWITPADLSKIDGIEIFDSERKITDEAVKEYNLTILPENSIIISARAPVGYVALVLRPATFNQGCKGLIPRKGKEICSLFYVYYLIFIRKKLQKLSGGSTFRELSKRTLENLYVPLPPLSEQKKIAEILSTVDKKLELEKRRKEKLERIKKQMMYDLLTGRRRVKL